MPAEGASPPQIAAVLNKRGIPTARGGKWAKSQVAVILKAGRGMTARVSVLNVLAPPPCIRRATL